MIKILFLIPELSGGGAEKVLCNLVNNMDQSRFDITVHTVNPCDYRKYLSSGIRHRSILKCKNKLVMKISRLWFRLCTEFKLTYPLYIKDDYDIEVAYLECEATKVLAASTNKRAKKIAWVHCDLQKKGIVDKKTAGYYSHYDKVVCVSEDVKQSFDEVYGECIESVVINNVIDEEEIIEKSKEKIEWPLNGKGKKIVSVGRLSEEKNYSHLIDTCIKLKNDSYEFSLVIVGDGVEYKNLHNQIKENRMEEYILLKGFEANPYPWIREADYVVCSSKYEGSSTVVQEALILGKIVITTPCGGMSELLGDSEMGLITDDTEDGLYLGIKEIIDDSGYQEKIYSQIKAKKNCLNKRYRVSKNEEFFKKIIN
jgi:glycosyltransferase involved in cell wall biosynthesis